ncbi:MAG: RNA polymerase sigma factor, partial [Candidatus Limnocylindrales bacterium]
MAETAALSTDTRLAREEAFGRLVSRELTGAYRTAAVILGDPVEAEDATQDALVRAWQHWEDLSDPAKAGAWFGRILVNVCRDRLRTRRANPIRWLGGSVAQDAARAADERDALWLAIATLSPDHRIAIVLRYYVDLPVEAIAERTGVPTGTVKS